MATDTLAMGLLIRMMPLVQREFSLRIEPTIFFDDTGYRTAIIDSALQSSQPRLVGYAQQLRERLAQLSAGPPGALRSAPAANRGLVPLPPSVPNAPGVPSSPASATSAEPLPADPSAARKYVGKLR